MNKYFAFEPDVFDEEYLVCRLDVINFFEKDENICNDISYYKSAN